MSIDWAQLSTLHLKTDTKPSLQNVFILNENRSTDSVQKYNNMMNYFYLPIELQGITKYLQLRSGMQRVLDDIFGPIYESTRRHIEKYDVVLSL
jgi:hypothetical protein